MDIHRDSGSHRDTICGAKDDKYSVRFRLIWVCPKPLIVSQADCRSRTDRYPFAKMYSSLLRMFAGFVIKSAHLFSEDDSRCLKVKDAFYIFK